jgi:hypothetical protein
MNHDSTGPHDFPDDAMPPLEIFSAPPRPVSFPSAPPVPSTTIEAYTLGVTAGEQREDFWFAIFAALEGWKEAKGSFVATDLLCGFIDGWFEGSAAWFDANGKGGGL